MLLLCKGTWFIISIFLTLVSDKEKCMYSESVHNRKCIFTLFIFFFLSDYSLLIRILFFHSIVWIPFTDVNKMQKEITFTNFPVIFLVSMNISYLSLKFILDVCFCRFCYHKHSCKLETKRCGERRIKNKEFFFWRQVNHAIWKLAINKKKRIGKSFQ